MKKILIATAVAAALVSGAAIAKPGAYVGLNLGYGGMDTPTGVGVGWGYDLRGVAGRIDAGYLWGQGALNYGAEVGYATYADNKYTRIDGLTLTYKGYNVDLLGVVKYNLNPNWNIFGKAGVAYVGQKTTGNSIDNQSKSKFLPEVAVGGGYEFVNGLGLNLTYSHIFGSEPTAAGNGVGSPDDFNKVASVNMLTFGISYSF